MTKNVLRSTVAVSLMAVLVQGCSAVTEHKVAGQERPPALVVSAEPPPEIIYQRGSRDTVLAETRSVSMDSALQQRFGDTPVETVVTRKVAALNHDLTEMHGDVEDFRARLDAMQSKSDGLAAEYYTLVASINTELQSGTTAGNPVLTERWNQAQTKLEIISKEADQLNTLAADAAAAASKAAWLQESARATYGLSGAVEEDHKRLQTLEDDLNKDIVALSRLLTSVNDETNRRSAYLRAERLNLQTLALGIANGELYGQNVANTLFRKAAGGDGQLLRDAPAAQPANRRPLVIIRFDRADVDYQQPLYTAVSQALDKFPAAKFDLVAVSRAEGNPAELALATTETRKNGEAVLRALTQMGVPLERIRLNAANAKDVTNSEVHLFIQ